jgi:putative ABC transport system substrate-binding protein
VGGDENGLAGGCANVHAEAVHEGLDADFGHAMQCDGWQPPARWPVRSSAAVLSAAFTGNSAGYRASGGRAPGAGGGCVDSAKAADAQRREGRMKRRALVLATGLAALGAGRAQPARPSSRVAVLAVAGEAAFAASLQALRGGLRTQGFIEGGNLAMDVRHAGGRSQDLPRLAAELAALKPDVFIATGKAATDAALAATTDAPIVALGDLVAAGHAAQLDRPGGRVTGVSFLPAPLNAKRLELLAAVLPRGSAVLNLGDPNSAVGMQSVEAAGQALGLELHAAFASTPAQIDAAFAGARRQRLAGVNVLNSPFLSAQHGRIIALAAAARLPAIYQWPESADEGGLMGYGPSLTAMFRQLAGYAARILGGAKPSDLPIEQPTRLELVINLKTAKALGIAIPRTLLLRADRVIE